MTVDTETMRQVAAHGWPIDEIAPLIRTSDMLRSAADELDELRKQLALHKELVRLLWDDLGASPEPDAPGLRETLHHRLDAHEVTKREMKMMEKAHAALLELGRDAERELADTRARLESAEGALRQCKDCKHRYSVKSTISEFVDDAVDAHFARFKPGGGT